MEKKGSRPLLKKPLDRFMGRALIATDSPSDRSIASEITPTLEGLGYEWRLVSPLIDVPGECRQSAIRGERIDLICLVCHERHRGQHTRVRNDFAGGGIRFEEIAVESIQELELMHGVHQAAAGGELPATDPIEVAGTIRAISHTLVFPGAVKASSTPILVVFTSASAASVFDRAQKPRWCRSYNTDASTGPMRDSVLDLVAEWHGSLISELNWAGFSLVVAENGQYELRSTFRRHETEGNIVTSATDPQSLSSAGFLIASRELEGAIRPVQQFAWLIENYRDVAAAASTKPEEVFQRFLDQNPRFLTGDAFARHIAKPRLALPEEPGRFIEPDFVLQPHAMPMKGTNWQLLDVKLPDVRLLVNGRFHATFSSDLNHAIQQLRDYRYYFNRVDASEHLVRELGYAPRNPKLAVLIGKSTDERLADQFGQIAGSANALDVQVINYDELLEHRRNVVIAQAEVLDRLGQLRR